jgi:hypothetical protein
VDRVCGCDGNIYNSPCQANAAGQDINNLPLCTSPPGTFACGPRFCMHGAEYCEAKVGGSVTNPGSYVCYPLPAACSGTPSCQCVSGSAMCGNCTVSGAGDVSTACLFP